MSSESFATKSPPVCMKMQGEEITAGEACNESDFESKWALVTANLTNQPDHQQNITLTVIQNWKHARRILLSIRLLESEEDIMLDSGGVRGSWPCYVTSFWFLNPLSRLEIIAWSMTCRLRHQGVRLDQQNVTMTMTKILLNGTVVDAKMKEAAPVFSAFAGHVYIDFADGPPEKSKPVWLWVALALAFVAVVSVGAFWSIRRPRNQPQKK